MDEKTAIEVFRHYLYKKLGVWLDPRSSGPDFLYKGQAWEVKGSKLSKPDFIRMLGQLVRYGLEYGEVTIVLPVDALDTAKFLSFHFLASCFWQITGKFLRVCLITRGPKGYYIREFYDGGSILSKLVENYMKDYVRDQLQNVPETSAKVRICVEAFGKNVDEMLKTLLHAMVLTYPDAIVKFEEGSF